MTTWAGLRRQRAGQGFTLIELLLTTVLILLLLGAVVFSFDRLQQGVELEEAARQMEGLLHYLRAQAAQTGRKVQLNFEEKIDEDFFLALGGLRALWEPDPLEQPGVFKELPEAKEWVKGIADEVMIESVQMLDANGKEAPRNVDGDDLSALFLEEDAALATPPINFYPDGSSDSARIIITSWEWDDPRRMEVKLLGMTGTIRRRMLPLETDELDWETPEETEASGGGAMPAEKTGQLAY